ncbi:unnamed protein product [Zymoseptoria tritici ST99CH_1A5]|uniref:Uncharacterized protein n=1 Tax=Zymoseptoria tritici ST99CH_1A5 TaxID=1276529 RepID=A0A1Y6LIZ8_ZYMTR|nr:unnamed protein product [Zymoseptoria tritici ST99CH_1A5]
MSIFHKEVSASVGSSQDPLKGLWKPTHLQRLYYGSGSVKENLLECLPSETSKAFIITGASLANKTSLIKQVEEQLGSRHAGTFSKIGQHAPVKQLDEATELVKKDDSIDTIISIGGGSPIDSAKAISYRLRERSAKFLYHIAIPTTLSAAECTLGAGYTNEDGMKTGVGRPELAPSAILYDSKFALETPEWLWMSTGMRAMDHAMELMYHPTSTEMPCRQMALFAAGDLFTYLKKYHDNPKDEQVITKLQLAAFASLGFLALNIKGGLGLSHTLGYALGSPFGIPHGITSCLTLGHVVKLKAESSADDAAQIARMAPFIGIARSGDDKKDGIAVGDAILKLVEDIGLKTTLTEKGVGKDKVHFITKTASGQDSGPAYDKVKELVENLQARWTGSCKGLNLSRDSKAASMRVPTSSEMITSARLQAQAHNDDVFWKQIHNSRGGVRTKYQFQEGDFGTAFQALRRLLRSLGLWEVMTTGLTPFSEDGNQEEKDEREVLEAWAVNHTLPFICGSILDRWTLERPVNGPRLLNFLETTACKPFRLVDLPRELRDKVYDRFGFSTPAIQKLTANPREWLEDSAEPRLEPDDRYDFWPKMSKEWKAYMSWAKTCRLWENEAFRWDSAFVRLSLVSQEFRNAAVERYFAGSKLHIDTGRRLDPLLGWADKVGMNKLRHLRYMHVGINWYRGENDYFTVSFHSLRGLKAEYQPAQDDYGEAKRATDKRVSEYTMWVSRHAITEGWNSTGVIDFFVADPDALRIACWGPHYNSGTSLGYFDAGWGGWNEELESIDERNAYEVAYGRIEPCCAW